MQVRHNETHKQFEADVDGGTAVCAYERDGNVITFTHTEVPRQAEGTGVAGKLVEHALQHAKGHDLRVVPACPYVAAYIQRHPEHAGLLDTP